MAQPTQSIVVIGGGDSSFNYLIERYAYQAGHSVTVMPNSESAEAVCRAEPAAVIFASVECLGDSQPLVTRLADWDVPIVVCSSTLDQDRTQELGADFCLLHPFGYDDFAAVLEGIRREEEG